MVQVTLPWQQPVTAMTMVSRKGSQVVASPVAPEPPLMVQVMGAVVTTLKWPLGPRTEQPIRKFCVNCPGMGQLAL